MPRQQSRNPPDDGTDSSIPASRGQLFAKRKQVAQSPSSIRGMGLGCDVALACHQFCRRGQMRQKNGEACAGMPETRDGAVSHWPVD